MTSPMPSFATSATPRQWRAAALLVVSAVTTLSAVADLHWWGRPLFTLVFFLLVPGVAVVSSFELDDALSELTIGGAVSVGVSTLAAMVMLWCHAWHPLAAEVVLALLSAPLLVAQLLAHPLVGAGRAEREPADEGAGR